LNDRLIVNNELGRMQNVVVSFLRYYPSIVWGDRKTTYPCDSQSPCWGLNPGLPNVMQECFTITLQHEVLMW